MEIVLRVALMYPRGFIHSQDDDAKNNANVHAAGHGRHIPGRRNGRPSRTWRGSIAYRCHAGHINRGRNALAYLFRQIALVVGGHD